MGPMYHVNRVICIDIVDPSHRPSHRPAARANRATGLFTTSLLFHRMVCLLSSPCVLSDLILKSGRFGRELAYISLWFHKAKLLERPLGIV